MTMDNNFPSRKSAKATVSVPAAESTSSATVDEASAVLAAQEKAADLSGKYRVREGYMIPHSTTPGGVHTYAKGGDIVFLSDMEVRSIIKLSMHQRDANGGTNGPAIETENAYKARLEARRQHDEFMKSLADQNFGL